MQKISHIQNRVDSHHQGPPRGRYIAIDSLRTLKGSTLSFRQHQIVKLLARGKTMRKISRHLGLSFSTVHTHIRRLYMKLGVNNRTGAVVAFMKGRHLKSHTIPENHLRGSRSDSTQTQQILLSLTPGFIFCSRCGSKLSNTNRTYVLAEHCREKLNHNREAGAKEKSKQVWTLKNTDFVETKGQTVQAQLDIYKIAS